MTQLFINRDEIIDTQIDRGMALVTFDFLVRSKAMLINSVD